ncbi:MAG: hypothetical protein OXH00_02930 [Candidatus Poribacteria bacterium]|nr:hypothetical protein [Candidatus Poribacteria bacterium]
MEKKWIDPTEIYVYEVLNNRDLNQNYILDITESMTNKGFLPEFPIDVFRSENLANIETELPYVCACGAHRTLAATNAKLEKVLAHIHDGKEEAFIEMMHLDNFKFDPALNTGIGQPFTNKEKRAAVTQLLLLPKFFEQTNSALHELWNIPDTNIRRWRAEVVELLETNSPKLRIWAVSDGRLARLRELAASPERKDAAGKIVKIRKPFVDASDDEKSDFWDDIEIDIAELGETHDVGMDEVRAWMKQEWKVDSYWHPYEDVTMNQLRELHNLVLSKDAAFLQACLDATQADRVAKSLSENFEKAVETTNKVFKKAYAPQEDKWSSPFRAMRKRFAEFVRSQGEPYTDFQMEMYDYDTDLRKSGDAEQIQAIINSHNAVTAAIEDEADWLTGFMDAEEQSLKKERKKAEADWRKHRKSLIEAVQAYPRPVGETTLLFNADAFRRQDAGTFQKLIDSEEPSARKFTATIESEAYQMREVATAIKTDASWVQKIPVPKPLIEAPVPEETTETAIQKELRVSDILPDAEVISIKVCFSGNRDSVWFEDNSRSPGAVPLSVVPEEILANLVMLIRDTNRLNTVAGELVCALLKLNLNDFRMKYGLERACIHYDCSVENLCQITGLFPDQFDEAEAEAFRKSMPVPQLNAWINILESMKRDVETRENWVTEIT